MSRGRSYSDPLSSPPTLHPSVVPETTFSTASSRSQRLMFVPSYDASPSGSSGRQSLTQASLAQLNELPPRPRPRWQFHHTYAYAEHAPRRQASATPSVTSVSDGEEEEKTALLDREEAESWMSHGRKGKQRASDGSAGHDQAGQLALAGLAGTLPPEILVHIFHLLPGPRDVFNAMLVSRAWCLTGFPLLWHKPALESMGQLAAVARVLVAKQTSLPYAASIRRLNLSPLAHVLEEEIIIPFEKCKRVERLTLSGARGIRAWAMMPLIRGMPLLVSLDLANCPNVTDELLHDVAANCPNLQGLNLTGCHLVSDDGLGALAWRLRNLRRLKVAGCFRLTDESIIAVVRSNPHLLEIELAEVEQLTNSAIYAIMLCCPALRELKLKGNSLITDGGFANLSAMANLTDEELQNRASAFPFNNSFPEIDPSTPIEPEPVQAFRKRELPNRTSLGAAGLFRPLAPELECLRVVDLTSCSQINDAALDSLVASAPRLRSLTLNKCSELTDAALESVGRLGKNLHHLHLGHCNLITDAAVSKLAHSCTRIRYLDLACCPLLTDESVSALALNMPKLKRVGLVKVTNLSDVAVYALTERQATLERIHLSHCRNLSIEAVTFLLNRIPGLTHLSLTGVDAFKTPELQKYCRPTPADFSEHQATAFCVYSGHGITALRNHLNAQQIAKAGAGATSDSSTRRDSLSSTSSITAGPSSPIYTSTEIPRRSSVPQFATAHVHHSHSHSRETSGHSLANEQPRRSAEHHRDRVREVRDSVTGAHPPHALRSSFSGPRASIDDGVSPIFTLGTAFSTRTPNFLAPAPVAGSSRTDVNVSGRYYSAHAAPSSAALGSSSRRPSGAISIPAETRRPSVGSTERERPMGPRPVRRTSGQTPVHLAQSPSDPAERQGRPTQTNLRRVSGLRWVAGVVGWSSTSAEQQGR